MNRPPETLAGGGGREKQPPNHSPFPDLAEPTMPRPATRRAVVLEALRKGQYLTQIKALDHRWGWRLAADVYALRGRGWPIAARMIAIPGGNRIAEYWLPADCRQIEGA